MKNIVTLRQAFDEFHEKNDKTIPNVEALHSYKEFYICHDIAHVVFGCDTSFQGEAAVKLWTVFGTTLGFRNHFKAYSNANAFEMFKQYSLKHVFMNSFKVAAVVPKVIAGARRMKKKWPWASYEVYLDIAIDEIRSEFNIAPVAI